MPAKHGRLISIVAAGAGGELPLIFVPRNKVFKPTLLEINNRSGMLARVRGWDTFTDSQGVVHSSAANPVPLFDHTLAIGESISLDYTQKGKKALGTVVVQSDQAGAAPNDVPVGLWGEFE